MRTAPVIGIVLALAVAFALLAGSGLGASIFGANPGDSEATRTLEEVGEDAKVDNEDGEGGVSADVAGDNEPTLVGFAISGGQFIVSLVGAVALLPVTLTRLGFPTYFAMPAGLVAQTIATIGLFQFLRTGELI